MGGCTSKPSSSVKPNPYAPKDPVLQNDDSTPARPGKSPVRSSPAVKASPFFPFYTPSPARHRRHKSRDGGGGGEESKSVTSTPLRQLARAFHPPSPAKHIRDVLRRRKEKKEAALPAARHQTEEEEEEVGLDKRFGFSKDLQSRIELGEEIGRGHFGYTCSAKFKKGELKDQEVAVKVIPKSKMTSAISIEDVRREVKILRALSGHKNLVQFHDAFEDNANVYIVMELCGGGELLDRILARGGKYSEDDAKAVLIQILNVVAFCHLQGVVHRDLKPENFLYTSKEENSQLKVIDFGLSDFVRPDERLNDIVGSAYYVAPEVLHRSYTTEADVWSIGVIAYILLCGSRPFWARTESGIFRAVLKADPSFDEPPWPSLSFEAKDFVKRLLYKDPRKRMTASQALKSVTKEKKLLDGGGGSSGAHATTFKFNAQAPEFVPRSHTTAPASQVSPISGYFYPCFHYNGGCIGGCGGGVGTGIGAQSSNWIYVGGGDPTAQHQHVHDPAAAFYIPNPAVPFPANQNSSSSSKNLLSDDLRLKIVKQVEYQFTDMSLLANESISKHISKDPEGYVPISYIASTKKIKALTSNHHLVSLSLRSSSKLVVSEDGKKVKRTSLFTDRDREELQGRTVVAENLPDDHSYQNLERIFGVVGNVKAIRICHPPESNSSRPKGDFLMSNKIHALIEYDNTVIADKAVEKLNDERNWRKGLRVRLLLRCSPKSVLKSRRNFDGILIDDELPSYESGEDSPRLHLTESQLDNDGDDNNVGGLWGKGRGKGRGRSPRSYAVGGGGRSFGIGLGVSLGTPSLSSHESSSPKTATKGPRMPDGTKGFTMGRGKPSSISLSPNNL